MSNLIYYRDNILGKIKENKELEKLQKWISDFDGEEVKISYGTFSPAVSFSKYTLFKLIDKQIEYNNEKIDNYLALSFKGREEKNNAIGEEKQA